MRSRCFSADFFSKPEVRVCLQVPGRAAPRQLRESTVEFANIDDLTDSLMRRQTRDKSACCSNAMQGNDVQDNCAGVAPTDRSRCWLDLKTLRALITFLLL